MKVRRCPNYSRKRNERRVEADELEGMKLAIVEAIKPRNFSVESAAAYIGLSKSFLEDEIKAKRLRAYKYRNPDTGKITEKIVIEKDDLDSWWDLNKEEYIKNEKFGRKQA